MIWLIIASGLILKMSPWEVPVTRCDNLIFSRQVFLLVGDFILG